MKIKLGKNINQNITVLMRRLGYKPWRDPRSGKESFIRRMGASFYPRFHINCYLDSEQVFVIDLHFDARRPMHTRGIRCYEDEESEVVQREEARIRQYIKKM